MTPWLNKWLPILMGCHQIESRSLHFRGRPFPICARCTGELIGFIAAAILAIWFFPPKILCVIFLLPLILDGTIQRLTPYESTNPRRLWTGFLFGYGLISLFLRSLIFVFHLGQQTALTYFIS
ncbi:MAG TPA: DUF2085 domain-containing protein [Firmicutes bacterium]|nr:DUF2085 domain-containing protein [Bacillota bacterium]